MATGQGRPVWNPASHSHVDSKKAKKVDERGSDWPVVVTVSAHFGSEGGRFWAGAFDTRDKSARASTVKMHGARHRTSVAPSLVESAASLCVVPPRSTGASPGGQGGPMSVPMNSAWLVAACRRGGMFCCRSLCFALARRGPDLRRRVRAATLQADGATRRRYLLLRRRQLPASTERGVRRATSTT